MSSGTVATSDVKQETQKLLRAAALNIVVLIEHTNKFEGVEGTAAGFSGPSFKKTIDELAGAIDKEVTRFMIACKPPALDVEIKALCPKINAGFFQLVQQFDHIPKLAGKTYLESVRKAVSRSLVSIVMLFNSFIDDKVEVDKCVVADLAYTASSGIFWEHCKALSQIPADNKAAVSSEWMASVSGLIKDATEELCDSLNEAESQGNGNDDDNDSYSDDDSMNEFDPDISADRVADGKKIQKMVLLAKHTCDKIGLRCIRDCSTLDDERTIWLDRLVDLGKPVQNAVDDLIATLFIEDDAEWKKQSAVETEKLVNLLGELVTLAITFVDDSHLPWFELCRKQLDATKHSSNVAR
ncbi:hypothetical protein H4R99_006081 [Coemansia sp. RSA 1722]|nr:hypothetical protein LPJ57_000390 [Coemansia sp. RSA 486]KAJ2228485.1 hypothetical protein IWW45_006588 [Coemansia sp. RSA 485]KAJ2593469.1 hypothetical protein H4R99_006081 [Coemansia sp. RSA 1722]KAJ2601039.1 hypothetical protein GGF39_001459 [Coemansia sp. RSA 1721]KAJ2640303.1 hypothetical protein GGF40_000202 [Coemansia sp. RSA 1286]